MPSLTPYVNDLRTDDQLTTGAPRIDDWAELQQYFGTIVDRSKGWDITPEGKGCWFLDGFYVRSGVNSYITKVQNENETPLSYEVVIYRHWPDAPTQQHPPNPSYFPNADAGWTEGGEKGDTFGSGSVGGVNGGPDYIWVAASPPPAEPQHSDMAGKLGWMGDSDHVAPSPIFRFVTKQNGVPIPTPGDARIEIIINGTKVGYMPILTGILPPAWDSYQQVVDDDGNTLGFMEIKQG